jgi:hypothetical protein
MRARMTLTPLLVPPTVSRGWRRGLGLVFLGSLALVGMALLRTIHRVQAGESVYGHLLLYLFLFAYLVYLLFKVVFLPPVEK